MCVHIHSLPLLSSNPFNPATHYKTPFTITCNNPHHTPNSPQIQTPNLSFFSGTHSLSFSSSIFFKFFSFFLQNKFLSKFFRSFLSLIAQRREVGGIVGVSEERVGRLEEHAIQNVFFRQGIGVCAPCQQCLQFFLKKGTDGCCAGSSIFVAFLI